MEAEEEVAKNPWENFSQWLHCVCVVTFDLELGQALEVCLLFSVCLSFNFKLNLKIMFFT